MELIGFLRSVKEFSDLDNENISRLNDNSEVVQFQNEQIIQSRGDIDRYLWVVYEGMVKVVKTRRDGSKKTIASLKRGEIFGEMSIMTGEPSGVDILSSGRTKVLKLNREVFTDVIMTNPSSLKNLSQTITRRLMQREKDEDSSADPYYAAAKEGDIYDLDFSSAQASLKILVINSRVASLKYAFFDTVETQPLIHGYIDKLGTEESSHRIYKNDQEFKKSDKIRNTSEALDAVLDTLLNFHGGVIKNKIEIRAVGHRVVHGGDKIYNSTVIDNSVMDVIKEFIPLAPLHNPHSLNGIVEMKKRLPNATHVAVFDTAFHRSMPEHASMYALPPKLDIKKFGFHGINHNYVMLRAAMQMKRPVKELNIISCHLGNGSSMCAIDHGRCIDTTMGMTPMEGLPMVTRSGDIDPGILIHLMRIGYSPDELERILNRESGLLGVSGVSGGYMKDVLAAASEGNSRAKEAITMFCYRVKKYIGAYMTVLGGLDALVFTGGIGENSTEIRARVCNGLQQFGVYLFDAANRIVKPYSKEVKDISEPGAHPRILVIPSDEKRMIARETFHAVRRLQDTECSISCWKKPIPVNISAHHVHVNRETFQKLFGEGRELTPRSELSQPGQYAADEAVNLVGPKGTVERVRILGPYRKDNQVEISRTEVFKLGIDAPVRDSGDIEGTPGIILEGAEDQVKIEKGVICARRHIHMSPEDALSFGMRDRDVVMVKIMSPRELIFGDVLVRVHPTFRLDMHIDTDEGNAAEHSPGTVGYIEAIQSRAYM